MKICCYCFELGAKVQAFLCSLSTFTLSFSWSLLFRNCQELCTPSAIAPNLLSHPILSSLSTLVFPCSLIRAIRISLILYALRSHSLSELPHSIHFIKIQENCLIFHFIISTWQCTIGSRLTGLPSCGPGQLSSMFLSNSGRLLGGVDWGWLEFREVPSWLVRGALLYWVYF